MNSKDRVTCLNCKWSGRFTDTYKENVEYGFCVFYRCPECYEVLGTGRDRDIHLEQEAAIPYSILSHL